MSLLTSGTARARDGIGEPVRRREVELPATPERVWHAISDAARPSPV
jgi:hypothetical protein